MESPLSVETPEEKEPGLEEQCSKGQGQLKGNGKRPKHLVRPRLEEWIQSG